MLTVYGIETEAHVRTRRFLYRLQQPLPFTVLKRKSRKRDFVAEPVATALPITVLKLMVRHNIA